jgi:hypothetical protein
MLSASACLLAPLASGAAAGEPTRLPCRGHITSLGHEPHNYVAIYVQVDDLDGYLERAGKLGGKTLIPPTEVPGMGRFAWLTDPEGTIVGLWKPVNA